MDIEAVLGIMTGMVFILSFPVTMIYLRMAAARERREAREIYARIAQDRMEVIRAAIEAGFEDRELARLDRRLQSLIGQKEMYKLAGESVVQVPVAPLEERTDDLEDEIENIIERRKRKREREIRRQIDQPDY
jgi:hypothetical protein